jgi:hypothetical protein
MSSYPFHPQGIGMHGWSQHSIDTTNGWSIPIGRKNHLGTRIHFNQLPEDCKKLVMQDYVSYWDLPSQYALTK